MTVGRAAVWGVAAMAAFAPAVMAQDAGASLAPVQVIGVTVVPGLGVPPGEIAAPVQSATAADIERSGALDLSEFLERGFGSVHVNNLQGNPFQADVSYRGFTASPLLGTPPGPPVYMAGVRVYQRVGAVGCL